MRGLKDTTRAALLACAVAVGVSACGSGSSSGGGTPAPAPLPPAPPAGSPTADDAARFLMQASFGPTDADIARVQSLGYSGWIDEQFALPQIQHLTYVKANYNALLFGGNFVFMQDSFWQQAIPAPDQLRQRVKFALSQIVVVSAENGTIATAADGLANYMDLLGQHAFGNYRALLEAVATSPMMGIYLSHLRNQKADPVTGRVPDENFAREVMQLFSIGLTEINLDGTPETRQRTAGRDLYQCRHHAGWHACSPVGAGLRRTPSSTQVSTAAALRMRTASSGRCSPTRSFIETGGKDFPRRDGPGGHAGTGQLKVALDTLSTIQTCARSSAGN